MRAKAVVFWFACASLILVGCSSSGSDSLFSDPGTTPLAQRQTVSEYESDVEPAISEFMERLNEAGAGEFVIDGESEYVPCEETDESGIELFGSIYKSSGITPEEAERIGDELFTEVGFDYKTNRISHNGTSRLKWYDTENSGVISVSVKGTDYIGFWYWTGCRPWEKAQRVPPQWEQELLDERAAATPSAESTETPDE